MITSTHFSFHSESDIRYVGIINVVTVDFFFSYENL